MSPLASALMCLALGASAPGAPSASAQTPALQASPQASKEAKSYFDVGVAFLKEDAPDKAVVPLRRYTQLQPLDVGGVVLLARALRLSGEAADAASLLTTAIEGQPNVAALHAELGLLLRAQDEIGKAIHAYEKAVALAPDEPNYHFDLGEALEKRGDLDQAEAEYRKALARAPSFEAARVNLGRALATQGKLTEARKVLAEAVRSDPKDPEAHYNLGVLYVRAGNAPEAISEYRKAIALDPRHPRAHNNLGVALENGGHPEQAIVELLEAVKADPRYAEAHFNLGLAYFEVGNGKLATREFETALKLDPQASAPYLRLGQLYLQQGKDEKAVKAFQKAIAETEGAESAFRKVVAWSGQHLKTHRSPDAYRGLAKAYLRLHRPKKAVGTLETAVDQFPEDPSAHAALADAYLAMGDLHRAIREGEKRLALDSSEDAKLQLAQLWAGAGVEKKSEPLFLAVLEADPKNHHARMSLVDLYERVGDWAAAERALKEALSTNPKDASALTRLGILHNRKDKRPDLAVGELEKAVRLDPTQLLARAELGSIYARGGDVDRALEVLGKVLSVDPEQPYALLYLGQALYQKGKTAKAEASFQAAIRVDPTFASPHDALGQLYQQQGKKKDAIAEFEKAAALGDPTAAQSLSALGAKP